MFFNKINTRYAQTKPKQQLFQAYLKKSDTYLNGFNSKKYKYNRNCVFHSCFVSCFCFYLPNIFLKSPKNMAEYLFCQVKVSPV